MAYGHLKNSDTELNRSAQTRIELEDATQHLLPSYIYDNTIKIAIQSLKANSYTVNYKIKNKFSDLK